MKKAGGEEFLVSWSRDSKYQGISGVKMIFALELSYVDTTYLSYRMP